MQARITPSDLLATLSERYATKQFDPSAQIPAETLDAILESLRLAPSSFGLQPWRFILVEDPGVRKQLRDVSWGQSQVEDASRYLVFTTLRTVDPAYVREYIESTASIRGLDPSMLAGYEKMIVDSVTDGKRWQDWTQRQAYIAMGFAGLSAALLGVDSCMIEGIDPAAYDRILGLDGTPYAAVATMALGYRHPDDKTAAYAKSRFPKERVFGTV